jgi:cytochrome c-type biogenesis protein CcmH
MSFILAWGGPIVLSVILIAIMLRPLYRRAATAEADERARRLQIFRDQLADLDRDAADGRIGKDELEATRLEVQRRLLAAGAEEAAAPRQRGGNRLHLAIPLAVVLLAGPALLYLKLGQPGAADQPFASRGAEDEDRAEMAQLLDKLKEHLTAEPTDINGWTMYARSLRSVGRIDEAVEAYERALKLAPNNPDVTGSYGELLVEQAGGTVTPKAEGLFAQTRANDPTDPRPLFYGAQAKAQAGDREGALKEYVTLAEQTPKDAPWAQAVTDRITALAKELGRPVPEIAPKATAGGPDAAQVAGAAGMSDDDRKAMIGTMVARLDARLKEHPDDPEGWQKLGRAYDVMGEKQKSLDAYREAATRAPGRLDIQLGYAHAIYAPAEAKKPPPPEFITVMRHILTLDPDQAEALWFIGRDEAAKGNRKDGVAMLTRLLDKLPADAPVRGTVQKAIEQAKGG